MNHFGACGPSTSLALGSPLRAINFACGEVVELPASWFAVAEMAL
jgi:hypothetical protein